MGNVLRMDMYRLFKSTSYKVIWICVMLLNLSVGPIEKGLYLLAKNFSSSSSATINPVFKVAPIIAHPIGIIDGMLMLLSIVWFSYADLGHGYIKNIAGQLPKKGQTVISKFIAIEFHNLFLLLTAAVFQFAGLIIFRSPDFSGWEKAIGYFGVNWCLYMAISSLVLLFSTGFKSKNAATVVAVLMGTGMLALFYTLIDMGLHKIPFSFMKKFSLADYMPDALLGEKPPVVKSLIVSACFVVVLIRLTVYIFNKKDIK